jgi:hypothetical protein
MSVCKEEDDFIRQQELDRGEAHWVAELSNGETIYQDDSRPGESPPQAWFRLASYLKGTAGLRIVSLGLRFRTNRLKSILPANSDGYFFSRSAIGFLHQAGTLGFFMMGYLQKDKVMVSRWKVPELLLISEEERDVKNCERFLIRNP